MSVSSSPPRVRVLLSTVVVLLGLAAVWTPTASADTVAATREAPAHQGPEVGASDPRLHFAGRWERHYRGDEAATVNSGSAVTLRFTGNKLTGLFDVSTIAGPAPQLWVTVDGGPRSLVKLDRAEIPLAPASLGPGEHTMRIDVKDTDQVTNRWLPELQTAVVIKGFRLAPHARLLPQSPTPPLRMAFFGDSITEGIRALGMPLTPDGADGTRAYANLTARAFGADITQVGFGKQGVMRVGVGNVPSAPESYGYNFQGSPADPANVPDVVVLLQGSNDSKVTDEQFAPEYLKFLGQARAAAPHAWIFAMEPLIGRHAGVIRADVAATGDPRIVFVPTAGWLDRKSLADYTDTVHPTVAGHLKVAQKLIPIVHEVTGLRIEGSAVTATVPPVVMAPDGHTEVSVLIEQAWASGRRVSGVVDIMAPPGFTVAQPRRSYLIGPDGTAEVTAVLRGTAGEAGSGEVRVLVDGQTEALPIPLTVSVD